MKEDVKIAVLITCHNRREKTLRCLRALFENKFPRGYSLRVCLVDDGSTDGTEEAVRAVYPQVVVNKSDGSLFWNRGMHMAQKVAQGMNPDFYLWLNDDTVLVPGAISSLIKTYYETRSDMSRDVIIVGATADPLNGGITYAGAVSKSKLRRFTYARAWDERVAVECDVMNGNIVFVPKSIARDLVNIDPTFEHAMGDTDYALRARMSGYKVFVAPGVVGECEANPLPLLRPDSDHTLLERWRGFTGRKGLPIASWMHFTKRHGGILWFIYFVQPYANFWWRAIGASISKRFRC